MSNKIAEEQEVYFVFSQMYLVRQNEIAGRCNKIFNCGTVPVNNKKCPYTNICTEDSFKSFINMYPDTMIIYKGKISITKYVSPFMG